METEDIQVTSTQIGRILSVDEKSGDGLADQVKELKAKIDILMAERKDHLVNTQNVELHLKLIKQSVSSQNGNPDSKINIKATNRMKLGMQ